MQKNLTTTEIGNRNELRRLSEKVCNPSLTCSCLLVLSKILLTMGWWKRSKLVLNTMSKSLLSHGSIESKGWYHLQHAKCNIAAAGEADADEDIQKVRLRPCLLVDDCVRCKFLRRSHSNNLLPYTLLQKYLNLAKSKLDSAISDFRLAGCKVGLKETYYLYAMCGEALGEDADSAAFAFMQESRESFMGSRVWEPLRQ